MTSEEAAHFRDHGVGCVMETNDLKKGNITVNAAGVGTVTPKMVAKRAAELARINGRSAKNVIESDKTEAQRELTGGVVEDPKEALLESIPESERWEPVPVSAGEKIMPVRNDDDDEEGRSDNERLTEQGIHEAEHDQMRKASKQND
jgi:hypothetical protein